MAILWVIEKSAPGVAPVAPYLIGDFAIRLFGSVTSFLRLVKIHQPVMPDAVLINLAGLGLSVDYLDDLICCHLPDRKRIYLNASNEMREAAAAVAGRVILSPLSCSMGLSQRVQAALASDASHERSGAQAELRYRNLRLQFERLALSILPSAEIIALPLKEARLLRLFMTNPGKCFSRDELKSAIWESTAVSPRTIDSHVSRLRKRLVYAEASIDSVYGGGYVLR